MPLNPEESRRRDRSRDDRDRSRQRAPSPPDDDYSPPRGSRYSPPSSRHYEEDDSDRSRNRSTKTYGYEEERTTIKNRDDRDRDEPKYAPQRSYPPASPPSKPNYAMPGEYKHVEVEEDIKIKYGDRRGKEYYEETKYSKREESPPRDRPRYPDPETDRYARKEASPPLRAKFVEVERKPKYAQSDTESSDDDRRPKERGVSFEVELEPEKEVTVRRRGASPQRHAKPSYDRYGETVIKETTTSRYEEPKKWEYARPDEKISYSSTVDTYVTKPNPYDRPQYAAPTTRPSQSTTIRADTSVVTVEPGRKRGGTASLGVSMGSLSVGGAVSAGASLANAPGSPLLEAYRGTYQSISDMPSPLMIAAAPYNSKANVDVEILNIEPASQTTKRRARFHDLANDASILKVTLRESKSRAPPDPGPLIQILPALTHDQIMDLRVEYKKQVKTPDMKGVNIAKHIKVRLKEDRLFLKACYATALGQWESEAYWANSYYQGEKTSRELLIESLMGRTNKEIRLIKDAFHDKKYSDSLVKCMRQELKEDKFKKAVMLVLEEKRQDERPGNGVDRDLVEDDVRDLYRALRSERGGESLMIQIIILRSDSHIREILRLYEGKYRANFAREMLKKSGNLVGEMLAHILNGIINRPVRDALLLNHALTLTKADSMRNELLISRLVRYHWDRTHMEAVKREYRNRYNRELQDAVRDGTKGAWGDFCEQLCVRRMPDEVRRVERVERVEVSSTSYRGGRR